MRNQKQPLLSSSFKYKEQDPSFYGEQLDHRYKKGPIQERKCTDIFCCLLILIMLGGMGFVGYIGFKNGKPMLLAAPFDQAGNQCGVDIDYINHQKIFISIKSDDPTDVGFVCVKQCPISDNSTLDCVTNTYVQSCSILKIYEAKTIVNLCYPNAQVFDLFNFDQFMDISVLQQYFADLKDGWPLLIICVAFSFVISMVFTVFIRFCAGCFVWISILCFWLLLMSIATASFFINQLKFLQDFIHYNDLPDNLKDRNYQVGCAITCWVLSFIVFLIVCCFQRQIRISIGILKASADFTREKCIAFLIPVYVTIMQIIFLAFWLTAILYIFSSAEKIQPFAHTPFAFVQFDTTMQLYTLLYLLGLLWIVFFLEALGDYWVCSTVAIWYFEEGEPRSPIYRSICRSFKQFGSLAFGSLIIAFVVLLRVLLQYFTKVLKQQTLGIDQQVGPAKYALKCASCCIACFERIVRFLTRNAYVMMAISGKGFCQSAAQSFYVMMKSTAQFSISHGTTKIFILFSKLSIVAICCVCGYFSLTQIQFYRINIYSPVFLTILFAIVSYPIASAFLNLFEMASNTILMCYCIQCDLKTETNPKCPPGLRNFLREYVNQSVASSQIR